MGLDQIEQRLSEVFHVARWVNSTIDTQGTDADLLVPLRPFFARLSSSRDPVSGIRLGDPTLTVNHFTRALLPDLIGV